MIKTLWKLYGLSAREYKKTLMNSMVLVTQISLSSPISSLKPAGVTWASSDLHLVVQVMHNSTNANHRGSPF